MHRCDSQDMSRGISCLFQRIEADATLEDLHRLFPQRRAPSAAKAEPAGLERNVALASADAA
jgi:hypothetical protein